MNPPPPDHSRRPMEVVVGDPVGDLLADPCALDVGGPEVDALRDPGFDGVLVDVAETVVVGVTPVTRLVTLKSMFG